MKRPGPRPEDPGLFDLPLDGPARREPAPPATRAATAGGTGNRAETGTTPARPVGLPRGESRLDSPPPRWASLPARIAAGGADLAALGSAALAVAAGTRLLGHPGPWPWPPFALFLLAFSFLYTVVPLAFWGQTPGMAWRGLVARSLDGDALSFGQTFRRWIGSVLTVAGAGLPLLLALLGDGAAAGAAGRSLADRISGSHTLRAALPEPRAPLAPAG